MRLRSSYHVPGLFQSTVANIPGVTWATDPSGNRGRARNTHVRGQPCAEPGKRCLAFRAGRAGEGGIGIPARVAPDEV